MTNAANRPAYGAPPRGPAPRRGRPHLVPAALSALALAASASTVAGEVRLGDHTFTIPEGFEIELACGPPLVDRPISADFDEEGRLYVTDSSGFSGRGPEQLEKKPHRVVRLVDTDGDGRFDESTVFADGMMFPEGAMWSGGSFYVAAPPSIWKLTDTDGDGVADAREEWFQGKTLTGCANDLHGPYLGLDGWIYWAKGAFAKQTYERPGGAPFETRAAHLFRWRADREGIIEPVMTGGMDNPIDVVFTPEGERIFTTTFLQHPGGGRRDGLIHAIYGGVYGKVHDVLDDHRKTGDIMPVLKHLGPAVPCGLTSYRSSAFGEGYRDNLFATLFNLHKVTRFALEPRGATFDAEESDFVVSDNVDFHPTDVIEDADGSLIVLDTGGWYKVCCPSSQLAKPDVLGAIYRVRRTGSPRTPDPRGLKLAWEDASAADLAGRLDDPRPAVLDRALARLSKSGPAAVPALKAVIETSPSTPARRNAVWTLTRIDGAEARAVARHGLADPDDSVRQAATHSASVRRDRDALPGLLAALATGPDPVRRSAAEALGRIGDPSAVPGLLAAAGRPVDRALEHSLIYAMIEIGDAAATRPGLVSLSSSTRKAALVALDQMDSGGLTARELLPFLTAESSELRQAGIWVLGHRAAWAGDLVGFLADRLASTKLEAADDLKRVLALFAGDGAIQKLLAGTALDGKIAAPSREIVLEAMADSELKEAPTVWISALTQLLERREGKLVAHAINAAGRLRVPAGEATDLTRALLAIARDASTDTVLRVEALAAVPGAVQLEPALFDFLVASLDASGPVLLRTTAAGVLAESRLDRDQVRALIRAVKAVGPLEVNRLLGAFEKLESENLSLALIGALRESPGRSGLLADAFMTWLKKGTPLVRQKGEELLASLHEDSAEKRSHLLELAESLEDGDVRRGQKVFNGEKAACSACHSIGYLGGDSGPDLTRIGQVRTEHDLLESIVYPSITFVRSYEPMLVVSQTGEVFNGYLRKDAPDEVVLVTGPDKEARIARDEILEMKLGTTSIMPAGLTDQLSRQELADLLAFLRATRW